MPKQSAGLLLFRRRDDGLELLLAHPGGPLWARRDAGAWSILKGEVEAGEDALLAARREFREETGHDAPDGPAIPLGALVQPSRKVVIAFALEGDFDPAALAGETVEIRWPPRSGRLLRVPEIDRVAWFAPEEARRRLLRGQAPFVERLLAALSREPG